MVASALATAGSAVLIPFRQGRLDDLGCAKLCLGGMTSTRSVLQLVGAPALGRFSDTHGRGAAFAVAVCGNCASLVLFACTNSIVGLYISFIPQALLADRFGVMKAVVTDMTPETDDGNSPSAGEGQETNEKVDDAATATTAVRAGVLGRLGAATGVGLMLGPVIGSRVLNGHYQAAALGIIANLAMLAAVSFLPPVPDSTSASRAFNAPQQQGKDEEHKKKEPIAREHMPKTSEQVVEAALEELFEGEQCGQQWLTASKAEVPSLPFKRYYSYMYICIYIATAVFLERNLARIGAAPTILSVVVMK